MHMTNVPKEILLTVFKRAHADFGRVPCDVCADAAELPYDDSEAFGKAHDAIVMVPAHPENIALWSGAIWVSDDPIVTPALHISHGDRTGWAVEVCYTNGLSCHRCGSKIGDYAAGYFVDDADGSIEMWVC